MIILTAMQLSAGQFSGQPPSRDSFRIYIRSFFHAASFIELSPFSASIAAVPFPVQVPLLSYVLSSFFLLLWYRLIFSSLLNNERW